MKSEYEVPDNILSINVPKVKWEWDFFGGGEMVVSLTSDVSWVKRLSTRIWFGSKWRKKHG